jgi:two-component system sensor histidine kinase DegS
MDKNIVSREDNRIIFYDSQLKEFYEIGQALSSEKDTIKLLELIINNSMGLTSSDAGTIYLVVDEATGNPSFIQGDHRCGKILKFTITKNQSIAVQVGENKLPISPQSICGYTAVTGLPLIIDDAYAISSKEKYCHNKTFDLKMGYLTKSILSVPMKTREDKIMGVIQLINKKKPGIVKLDFSQRNIVENVISFDYRDELMITSLAGQAAVALENSLLYRQMEGLIRSYKAQNEQLEILNRNVLKAHEEERKRIAREIHDGPTQLLVNLSLEMEICKKYLQMGKTQKAVECLSDLDENVKAAAKEMRMVIYDLRPSFLEEGLLKALQNRVDTFKEKTGIQIEFAVSDFETDFEYYFASTIYRIVQEALTNIYKHANAERVKIVLDYREDNLILLIKDDGQGFDLTRLSDKKQERSESGFGLEGMRERVELLKGTMGINSKPGEGTEINLSIPLRFNDPRV